VKVMVVDLYSSHVITTSPTLTWQEVGIGDVDEISRKEAS
jgi:hypothetical protein